MHRVKALASPGQKIFPEVIFLLACLLLGPHHIAFSSEERGHVPMSIAIGRRADESTLKKEPIVSVLKRPVSSKLDDLGAEIRPHLPHACCSGEAGYCYPRIKVRQ